MGEKVKKAETKITVNFLILIFHLQIAISSYRLRVAKSDAFGLGKVCGTA
jgi:hypothetical protein